MTTYIYKVENNSKKRGYNRTITVFRIKHNRPYLIECNEEINTNYYIGNRGEVKKIIKAVDNPRPHTYNLWEV
jgi:hypothetical protein